MKSCLRMVGLLVLLLAAFTTGSMPISCGDAIEDVADAFENDPTLTCQQLYVAIQGNNSVCIIGDHEKYIEQTKRIIFLFITKQCPQAEILAFDECSHSGVCFLHIIEYPETDFVCGENNENLDDLHDCLVDKLINTNCAYTYKYLAAVAAAGDDVCAN